VSTLDKASRWSYIEEDATGKTMLRCHYCNGAAHPALAHLHGLSEPLCKRCSDIVVSRSQEVKVRKTLKKAVAALLRNQVRLKAA